MVRLIITILLAIASITSMKSFKQYLAESPEKQNQEEDDPFGGNETVRRLYGAIVSAEHEGEKIEDPYAFNEKLFIRTRAGGGKSTAYGPAQITYSTAKGFLKTQPNLFAKNPDYTNAFIAQGGKMLKADVKDKKYGLGCVGDLCAPENNKKYQQMAAAIILGKAKEKKIDLSKDLSDQDLNKFIGYWRGADEKADPRYFATLRKAYRGSKVKTAMAPQPPQLLSLPTTPAPQNNSIEQT